MVMIIVIQTINIIIMYDYYNDDYNNNKYWIISIVIIILSNYDNINNVYIFASLLLPKQK